MRTPTPSAVKAVQSLYPTNQSDAFDLFAQDVIYACHVYNTAKIWGSNAYRYSMSIPPANHGQDQFYYFYAGGPVEATGVEFPNAATTMEEYFREFIFDGRTGGDGCSRVHWPAYGTGGR